MLIAQVGTIATHFACKLLLCLAANHLSFKALEKLMYLYNKGRHHGLRVNVEALDLEKARM